jgi:hypothetical protein
MITLERPRWVAAVAPSMPEINESPLVDQMSGSPLPSCHLRRTSLTGSGINQASAMKKICGERGHHADRVLKDRAIAGVAIWRSVR